MPTLRLTNLATYRTYFQGVATAHKQIDGFKWGDKDVIRNDNRSDLASRFLWAMPYDSSRYTDRHSDNVVKAKVARVAYMIVPDSELFADEDAAFDFCEAVIEDILTRLFKDKRGAWVDMGSGLGEYQMIATDINSLRTGPVEKKFGSTKYIGWELEITFIDNTNLEYDETKWD